MVYETDYITKKTTFLPRLIGVELVVIGFELVGFGLELELELGLGRGLGLGFGFELVVIRRSSQL